MIGMIAIAGVTLFTTLSVMQSANTTYIKSMRLKAEKNIDTAREVQRQTEALSRAKSLYFKTYGIYPSSVQELIDKKMLRANYKTTLLSNNISLDSSGDIKVTTSNTIINSYINANSKNTKSKLNTSHSDTSSISIGNTVTINVDGKINMILDDIF